MRDDADRATGGDLEILQCSSPKATFPDQPTIRVDELPMELGSDRVKTHSIARYEANTLVVFLNSARSIHAVSPRSPTSVPRRHINFSCDLPFDLFKLDYPIRLVAKRKLGAIPLLWRLSENI